MITYCKDVREAMEHDICVSAWTTLSTWHGRKCSDKNKRHC